MEDLGSLNFQSAVVGQSTLNCRAPVGACSVVQRNGDVMVPLSNSMQLPAPAKTCCKDITDQNIKVQANSCNKWFLAGWEVGGISMSAQAIFILHAIFSFILSFNEVRDHS